MSRREGDKERVDAIESKIDELYQQPLAEFVAARNSIAKELRGADAKRVRQLPKPNAVAWAINQLYWRLRETYDRVRRSGERLRSIQIAALEGKQGDVRDATERHRKTVAEAAQAAGRLAQEAGHNVGADTLVRTLDALSLAPESTEAPGRLAHALQSSGFDALAGVTFPDRPSTTTRRDHEAPKEGRTSPATIPLRESDRQENAAIERTRRETAAALKRAESLVKGIRVRMAAAERQEAHTRKMWERAKRSLEAAQAELARATEAAAIAHQRAEAAAQKALPLRPSP